MKKIAILLAVAILLCTIPLSGCNEAKPSGTLKIVAVGTFSCEFVKYLNYYGEHYPDVTIEIIEDDHDHEHDHDNDEDCDEDEPGFYDETLASLRDGNMNADLIILDTFFMADFVDNGLLTDLNGTTIGEMLDNQELLDGVRRLCEYGDYLAGVPITIHYNGFAVNRVLLDKLGLDMPSMDWTYTDYYNIAQRISQSSENKYLIMPDRDEGTYINPLYGFDAANGSEPRFSTTGFIDYLRMGKEITDMGVFYVPGHFDYASFEELMDTRYGENILFTNILYSELHEYERAKFKDMEILPLPGIAGSSPYFGGTLMCLSSRPENRAAAEHFMLMFLSEEYQYENAFEMQIYRDKSKYTIMGAYSQSVTDWIVYCTVNYRAIVMPDEKWRWLGSVELPQGAAVDIDFVSWAEDIQKEAEMLT